MGYKAATLVGKAIGDALGKAFETMSPDNEALTQWDGKTFLPSEYHKLGPEQWTDDTLMAKSIADSLIVCGGYYPRDVADRYHAWYRTEKFRGMGRTTMKALALMDKNVPWSRSGIRGAEGNGTAMRIAPLGLFFHEDLPTVEAFAKIDARITHRSVEADAGAIAVALATAILFQKQDPTDLIDRVCPFLPASTIKAKLRSLPKMKGSLQAIVREVGTKAHVVDTVPAAFAIVLGTKSFPEAIEVAIRAGGDTDTTAAVVGALAGTLYGLDGIPKEWQVVEEIRHLQRLDARLSIGPRSEALWLRG